MLGLTLLAGTALAAPQLAVSKYAYQVTQVQPVPGNPRAFDVTSRVGIVNTGDPATNVTASLSSSHLNVQILDGDVSFGNVARTGASHPVLSRDTFRLRIVFPRITSLSQLLVFVQSLHQSLVWQVSCANCGATNRPPLANAGADQTTHAGQVATLNGGASSDPDGQALTYAWTLVSRPPNSQAVLNGATSVQPTFTADREGDYVVSLVVSDGSLSSAPDTVQVSTLNSPPVAHAGADQAAVVGQAVALSGAGSTDMDGDSLTYAWSVLSAPAGSQADIADPAAMLASFTPDMAGQYVIELVVHDGFVSSPPDTLVISTTPANRAPVANAGPDMTRYVGEYATLDGSASSDPDGNVLNYHWSLTSRPAGSLAALSGTATATPTFLVDRPGSYVAQLIVNDGALDSVADTMTVSTVNSGPVAYAGGGGTFPVGTRVQLDGTSSGDADNDPLSYFWSLLSIPDGSAAALSDPNDINPSFLADVAGAYAVQLIVNDGSVDSAPSTTTVIAESSPAPTDSDNDGVPDNVENGAPNNGDGNNDGIPDVQQLHVTSLPNAATGQYVTLVAPAGSTLANVRALATPAATSARMQAAAVPADVPAGLMFPWGLFEFEMRNLTSPFAQLEIILPAGAAPMSYWKYGPVPGNETPHWYHFNLRDDEETGAQFASNVVTLHFTDNARGDDDRTTDGVIIDAGGPTIDPGLVAKAGADQEGYAWNSMTLDASASDDNGSAPVGYEWTIVDWPRDSNMQRYWLNSSPSLELTPDAYGTYLVRLTVIGASGAEDSDELMLVVQPRARVTLTKDFYQGTQDGLAVGKHLQSYLPLEISSLVPGERDVSSLGLHSAQVRVGSGFLLTYNPATLGSSETSAFPGATPLWVQAVGSSVGTTGTISVQGPGYIGIEEPVRIDPAALVIAPGDTHVFNPTPSLPLRIGVRRVDALTGRVAANQRTWTIPDGCQIPACATTPYSLGITDGTVGTVVDENGAPTLSFYPPRGGEEWTAPGLLNLRLDKVGQTTVFIKDVPAGWVAAPPDNQYDSRAVVMNLTTLPRFRTVQAQASSTDAIPGEVVTFTVTSDGRGTTDPRVYIRVPKGMVMLTSNATQGTFDPGTGIWLLDPQGQPLPVPTLTITARVTEDFRGEGFRAEFAANLDVAQPVSSDNLAIVGLTPLFTFYGSDDFAVTPQDVAREIYVLENDHLIQYPTSPLVPGQVVFTIETPPAQGTAVIQNNGILYTPRSGFRGTDKLVYRLRDGLETQVYTLTIVVGNR